MESSEKLRDYIEKEQNTKRKSGGKMLEKSCNFSEETDQNYKSTNTANVLYYRISLKIHNYV